MHRVVDGLVTNDLSCIRVRTTHEAAESLTRGSCYQKRSPPHAWPTETVQGGSATAVAICIARSQMFLQFGGPTTRLAVSGDLPR
jgi:hypothetical protein